MHNINSESHTTDTGIWRQGGHIEQMKSVFTPVKAQPQVTWL